MEATLQHQTPPQCSGLSPASARNHHPDGSQADDALTINLDQSDEAAHHYTGQIKHLQEVEQIRGNADAKQLGRAIAALTDGMILHKGLFSIPAKRHNAMRNEAIDMFVRGLVTSQK